MPEYVCILAIVGVSGILIPCGGSRIKIPDSSFWVTNTVGFRRHSCFDLAAYSNFDILLHLVIGKVYKVRLANPVVLAVNKVASAVRIFV